MKHSFKSAFANIYHWCLFVCFFFLQGTATAGNNVTNSTLSGSSSVGGNSVSNNNNNISMFRYQFHIVIFNTKSIFYLLYFFFNKIHLKVQIIKILLETMAEMQPQQLVAQIGPQCK